MSLAEKLMFCGEVELSREIYSSGGYFPEIVVDKVVATIEESRSIGENKMNFDIVVVFSKEDGKDPYLALEIYRMPFIEDMDILEGLLSEAVSQRHLSYQNAFRKV